MNFKEIREAANLSLVEVAERMHLTSASGRSTVWKFEKRDDHTISTLASYVKACGGKAVIVVHVGEREMRYEL